MVTGQSRLPKRVGADMIICAITLLVGVLCTSYGYFKHTTVMLYIGLIVTLAGLLTGLLFILVSKEA